MKFEDLKLWQAEEEKMHECIKTALTALILSQSITSTDNEDAISGKLHRFLLKAKRQYKLHFVILRQIATYSEPDDAKPSGYPDIGFFWHDYECEQHEYHVECKRLMPKRPKKTWDFCEQYITNGVQRYVQGVYGKGHLSSTMIAYVQLGEFHLLLNNINQEAIKCSLNLLALETGWRPNSWTKLSQELIENGFYLTHYWVDLRTS
jgi:hypothetical protein